MTPSGSTTALLGAPGAGKTLLGLSFLVEGARQVAERVAIEAAVYRGLADGPELAMVDSDRGITNLHAPNDVIVDASMPVVVRDGGKMWNADGTLQDTRAIIPDRCYSTMYGEIIANCRTRLAGYKQPKPILLVSKQRLGRDGTGKWSSSKS